MAPNTITRADFIREVRNGGMVSTNQGLVVKCLHRDSWGKIGKLQKKRCEWEGDTMTGQGNNEIISIKERCRSVDNWYSFKWESKSRTPYNPTIIATSGQHSKILRHLGKLKPSPWHVPGKRPFSQGWVYGFLQRRPSLRRCTRPYVREYSSREVTSQGQIISPSRCQVPTFIRRVARHCFEYSRLSLPDPSRLAL